jgi:hypothetical protein
MYISLDARHQRSCLGFFVSAMTTHHDVVWLGRDAVDRAVTIGTSSDTTITSLQADGGQPASNHSLFPKGGMCEILISIQLPVCFTSKVRRTPAIPLPIKPSKHTHLNLERWLRSLQVGPDERNQYAFSQLSRRICVVTVAVKTPCLPTTVCHFQPPTLQRQNVTPKQSSSAPALSGY